MRVALQIRCCCSSRRMEMPRNHVFVFFLVWGLCSREAVTAPVVDWKPSVRPFSGYFYPVRSTPGGQRSQGILHGRPAALCHTAAGRQTSPALSSWYFYGLLEFRCDVDPGKRWIHFAETPRGEQAAGRIFLRKQVLVRKLAFSRERRRSSFRDLELRCGDAPCGFLYVSRGTLRFRVYDHPSVRFLSLAFGPDSGGLAQCHVHYFAFGGAHRGHFHAL